MSIEWKNWGVAAIVIVVVLVAVVVVGVVMATDYKKKHLCITKLSAAAVAEENISVQNALAILNLAMQQQAAQTSSALTTENDAVQKALYILKHTSGWKPGPGPS